MTSLRDAALSYVPRTLPLRERSKVPAIANWPEHVASEPSVRAWWGRRPDCNVGMRTGGGLVVLDVDPRAGGHDVLSDLEHENSELPETVTCFTGGGGRHYYFRGPVDMPSFDIAPGLEIKSNGKQVVAPPSVHPETGAEYRWMPGYGKGEVPLADLPTWLADKRPAPSDGRDGAYWVAEVTGPIAEGGRHTAMVRFCGHLLRKWVDVRLVYALALKVNRDYRPPLPEAEVEQIVDSVHVAEIRSRKRRGQAA